MTDLVKFVVMTAAGCGLFWLGWINLRQRRWKNGIPAIELAIDKIAGVEPPARTQWDQRFSRFHGLMGVMFGSFFAVLGAALIYTTLSE